MILKRELLIKSGGGIFLKKRTVERYFYVKHGSSWGKFSIFYKDDILKKAKMMPKKFSLSTIFQKWLFPVKSGFCFRIFG